MSEAQSDSLSVAVEGLEAALVPLTKDVSKLSPACLGAVVFVPDEWHAGDANAVATVTTLDAEAPELAFNHASIRGRRVDMTATTLGVVFRTQCSGIAPSLMNPDHTVWSKYLKVTDSPAVLQIAFDNPRLEGQSVPDIREPLNVRLPAIRQALAKLLFTTQGLVSLGNELRLNLPVTPNAFLLKWDVVDSTSRVDRDYPGYRNPYDTLSLEALKLVEEYGAEIESFTGDGQNIVLWLPPGAVRNSTERLRAFGQDNAERLAEAIQASAAHNEIDIRLAIGFGRVEAMRTRALNGPEFWRVNELFDCKFAPNTIAYTSNAQGLLDPDANSL